MVKSNKTNIGKVVSKSGDKTIKVISTSRRPHPMYKKIITITRYVLVHDQQDEANVGDVVEYVSCRPISKNKTNRLVTVKEVRA